MLALALPALLCFPLSLLPLFGGFNDWPVHSSESIAGLLLLTYHSNGLKFGVQGHKLQLSGVVL
jgi:hypothetical protein